MNYALRPDLAQSLEKLVRGGRYSSAEDAVNAAVTRLLEEEKLLAGEPDDQTWAAIEEGLGQIERGEVRPWEDVRAELMKKIRPAE